jgi:hypothetical protein
MISEALQNKLKAAILEGEKFPLLIKEDDKFFIPYDEIHISAKPRPDRTWYHGHFVIEFRYRGELIKTQNCGPIQFSAGDTLTLTAINGRIELYIT